MTTLKLLILSSFISLGSNFLTIDASYGSTFDHNLNHSHNPTLTNYTKGVELLKTNPLKALAYLRGAFYQQPHHKDIRKAYFLSLKKTHSKTTHPTFDQYFSLIPLELWILFIGLFLGVGSFLSFKNKKFSLWVTPAIPLILCLLFVLKVQNSNFATVVSEENLRLAPNTYSEVQFYLPSGTAVTTHDSFKDWVLVRYKDKVGWIKKSSIIVPEG